MPAAVKMLRAEPGGEICVGSAGLIRAPTRHGAVNEYRLAVYSLVLDTVKKLFADRFTFIDRAAARRVRNFAGAGKMYRL